MRVAVIQMNAGSDKARNLNNAEQHIQAAVDAKACFILLPEVFIFRGSMKHGRQLQGVSEFLTGPTIRRLSLLASQNKIYILAGSILERVRGSQKVYNTSVLINNKGVISARYRKNHLFDVTVGKNNIRESECFLPGRRTAMSSVGPFRVGMSICFDLRFPELYKKYHKRGADILTVPSAFIVATGKVHWKVLLQARAIENQCYVLAPNQTGKDARGIASFGHSMIIDPWGKVLAEAGGTGEDIIYADLDVALLKRIRQQFPLKG